MFVSISHTNTLVAAFESAGLSSQRIQGAAALVKINAARPPEVNRPGFPGDRFM